VTVTDFGHGYTPPGVYIEESDTPLVTTTGVPPMLVALIGQSAGFQTHVEQVPLSNLAVRLDHQGIDSTSITLTRADTGAPVPGSDYATAASGPLTNRDYYLDLTRTAASALTDGTLVNVFYRYTDPAFFTPKTYDNYEDVKDAYGEPLNLSPQTPGDPTYQAITSPLSLAAKIAFENGAGQLVLVATTPPAATDTTSAARSTAKRNALASAYAKIATNYNISVVVPITDGILAADAAGVATDLRTHLENASADGYLRTGIIGFDPTVTATTAPDMLLASGGFKSKRINLAFASPSGMSFYNGGSNQTLSIGHQYLAAALAGRRGRLAVAKALTRETLRSFAGLAGTPLSNTLKNQYAAAGVLIVEVDRQGALSVRHDVTTDVTNVNSRESSVVRGRDAMVVLLQTGTEAAGLIGQPIDDTTTLSVKSVISGLLDHAVLTGLVVATTDLAVRLRSTDPSVIEVKFAYRPAYPLNYIAVSFSINVATGETEDLTDTAA
jgi:hypothetical protein